MSEIKLREGVVLTEIQGTYLLAADKEARKSCPYVRQVNEVGAFVWKQLREAKDLEEIAFLLRQEYDVPKEYDPKVDVEIFIQLLKENNYIINEAAEYEV